MRSWCVLPVRGHKLTRVRQPKLTAAGSEKQGRGGGEWGGVRRGERLEAVCPSCTWPQAHQGQATKADCRGGREASGGGGGGRQFERLVDKGHKLTRVSQPELTAEATKQGVGGVGGQVWGQQ